MYMTITDIYFTEAVPSLTEFKRKFVYLSDKNYKDRNQLTVLRVGCGDRVEV